MLRHAASALILSCSFITKGQNISELKPLSFGNLAIIDYQRQGTVTIAENARPQATSNILFVEFGHVAEILLTNFPSNRQINLQSTIYNDWLGYDGLGASDSFQLLELYHEDKVFTDSAGSAAFKVGGQLRFAGHGKPITGRMQSLNVEITLSY